jgi:GDP/UDP-N,N'-diacetylbacillosamine 2-epimerase (hydrolysing)
MRQICYITGTRADFGLMHSTLSGIHGHSQLELSIAITGMHLDEKYGDTKAEVVGAGFQTYVVGNKEISSSRLAMAASVGDQVSGFSELFSDLQPTVILVLGDRGEMLAASIAALYLNIPVVHVHGGELSGTVDESIRHAISKLSHFHFVATETSKQRLIRMGEKPSNVFVTGAPGLDDIINIQVLSKDAMLNSLNLEIDQKILTVIFHPVVQDAELAGFQMQEVLFALPENCQVVILMPNSDAGGELIREKVKEFSLVRENVRSFTHISRETYLGLLAHSDVLIGNSSSGIIEAASFSTWVINIGDRQANRERNINTVDVEIKAEAIELSIISLLNKPRLILNNVYGDGKAGARITRLLSTIEINNETTKKRNAY